MTKKIFVAVSCPAMVTDIKLVDTFLIQSARLFKGVYSGGGYGFGGRDADFLFPGKEYVEAFLKYLNLWNEYGEAELTYFVDNGE